MVIAGIAVLSLSGLGLSRIAIPGDEQPAKITWHSFQEAVALSKKEKKKIFIDVFTDWCGWCKVLDRNTFSNPVIIKYMNEHYYCVKLNAEMNDTIVFNNFTFTNPNPVVNPNPAVRKTPHQLATSLLDNKMGYPSMVFLDENFNRLFYLQSYLTPDQLEPYVKFVGSNSYLTVKWEDYTKSFKGEIEPPPPASPTGVPFAAPH